MRRSAFLLAALAAVLIGSNVFAQRLSSSREEELVRGWYRDYLGREVGPELRAWVQLLQGGMPPLDVQATILGSDEFYAQKGRDPQTFVLETLQSVAWQEPTAAELRRWTDRLTLLRGDRFAVAREILQAYGQSSGGPIGGVPDTTTAAEVATRITSASKLLVDTIDFEIGGTLQGRQANLRALSLYDEAQELQRILTVRTIRAEDAYPALQDVQRSFTALQSTLNNPAGTAPSSASITRRINTMLAEAESAIQPLNPRPTPNPGPAQGATAQKLLTQADAASRATQSIIQSVTAEAYQNYAYSVVLRDLDTFAARLDEFKNSVRQGASRERLQWEVDGLAHKAEGIGPKLLSGRPPPFTRLFWSSVESSLAQMAETLGIEPGGSTVLRPTPVHEQVQPLVDQAISRLDVFYAGTQPLVFGIPEVPRVQRDVRNLKNRLLTLRQQTADGEPARQLSQTLTSMVADYQNAYTRWSNVVSTHRLLNPPRLSPVGETLNQVEQILNTANGEEDWTGAAPGSVASSRISRLLETIDVEARSFREGLPPFGNYNEHRSLLLYLDQLDGYLTTIEEAQRNVAVDPTSLRRQAAGMQRVVELLTINAQNLEARAGAAGTANLRRQAAALRTKANRISDLVDDLESEVN